MGLILWIDKNTFASSLIEKVFKKKSLAFYTITNVDDFSYLVDDLRPALIVLDAQTYALNPQRFLDQYQASTHMQALPFVLIDPQGDFSFLKNHIGELNKPLDPFKIPEQLEKLLKVN